jgi:hypothetical protein
MRTATLLQTSPQSKVCIRSYGPPKLQESQFRKFRDPQLGSFGTKSHLGAGPMATHKEYCKGGRWWLPPCLSRGESYEFMFTCGLFMHEKCFSYTLTNLLFGLCSSVWIIDPLVILLNTHPGVPTCPFTLKVLHTHTHTHIWKFIMGSKHDKIYHKSNPMKI